MKRLKKAFTLPELLVVLTIISILSGIIIVNITFAREKARDAKRRTDIETIKDATELYYEVHQTWPGSSGTDVKVYYSNVTSPTNLTRWALLKTALSSELSLPSDPRNGSQYYYAYATNGSDYEINCVFERDPGSMANDGGPSDSIDTYEIGSDLTVIKADTSPSPAGGSGSNP